MKFILKCIMKHRLGFFMAIAMLTLEAVCDLFQPLLMSHIIDEGVAMGNLKTVVGIGIVMFIVALSGAACAVGRNFFASVISQDIGKEMRLDLYAKVQKMDIEHVDQLEKGSLITRITNDVSQIQNFISGCMRILVKAPISCTGAVLFIVIQTPFLSPLLIGVLLIASVWIGCNMKLGYSKFGKVQKQLDALNGLSGEYLGAVRVVKAFGQEAYEEKRFTHSTEQLASASVSAMRVNAIFNPLIQLTVNGGIIILLWVGSRGQGELAIGKLMASVNYMTQILISLGMVSNILNSMVRASASAQRVEEVLKKDSTMKQVTGSTPFGMDEGIVFENVTFAYPSSNENALENMSFRIEKGMTCGIIGSTGSGKTTLVQLLFRFYDVSKGQITVGGVPIQSLSLKALRDRIGLVTQKPILFTGTIESNLKWGNADVAKETLEEAMIIAQAMPFVEELDVGTQSILGQGGVNISGGQKQRLSLARALIKKPEILILDDSTSALDTITEAKVMAGLRQYTQEMTTFIISQRIGTVRHTDYILCLDNGHLVGKGTHEQLMAHCPVYQEIYDSQIGEV